MTNKFRYSYEDFQKILKDEICPCTVLDLETFDENLNFFEDELKNTGKVIRVGTKSVRVPRLIQRALDRPCFQGVFLFHPNEIKYLQETYNIKDFLLAYPIMNWKEADILCQGAAKDPEAKISVMVDSVLHLELLEKRASKANVKLYVLIDCDMAIKFVGQYAGVLRSPLKQSEIIVNLAKNIKNYPHLEFRGIMGYEAQEASIGDDKIIMRLMKQSSRKQVNYRRSDIVRKLKEIGMTPEIVNGGGSGCFQDTAAEKDTTEIAAGSALFKSYIFDQIDSMTGFKPSLFMALRIVRNPQNNIATAFSGGYYSSGSGLGPKIELPNDCIITKREGFGEVQTPIIFKPNKVQIKHGDLIICRLAKAGEPMERFNEVIAISKGEIIEKYPTYRGVGLWLG